MRKKRMLSLLIVVSILSSLIFCFQPVNASGSYREWKQYSGYWANYTMGSGSATVKTYGCTSTSIAIAAVQLGCESESNFDPGVFVTRMNNNSGYTSGGGIYWSVVHKVLPNFQSIRDITFSSESTATRINTIKSYRDSGYAVIVLIKRYTDSNGKAHWHYVVADNVVDGVLNILDPGGNNGNIMNKYSVSQVPIYSIQVYGKSGSSYSQVNPVVEEEPPAPVHVHSWTTCYETAHPHREYKQCSCGAKNYTGEKRVYADCVQCFPIGNAALTRSFDRTTGSTTFYRNNVANATSYTLTVYRKPNSSGSYSQYGSYTMSGTSYNITLPQGYYYYGKLTATNSHTSQTASASCDSFRIYYTYKISYNANGGSGAPSYDTKIQDETKTLSNTRPTRSHYIFRGWASSKSATEPQYTAGGTYTKNADITLYAVWEPETYTVSFNANGGKGELSNASVTYGNSLKMPNTIIKEGFWLKGWSTSSNSSTAGYKLGIDYKVESNLTLYAVWGNTTWNGSVASSFAGGDGSENDPYQISNAGELAYLASRVNSQTSAPEYKYYILTDNINLGYEEWTPIGIYGNTYQYFCGSFDGNGYTISDLSIESANEGRIGLFGLVQNSEIKNLTVAGDIASVTSTATINTGAIAGQVNNTAVENCNASYVNVSDISVGTSSYSNIGCLIGLSSGSIRNCTAKESYIFLKKGKITAGIIVGYSTGTDITDCSGTLITDKDLHPRYFEHYFEIGEGNTEAMMFVKRVAHHDWDVWSHFKNLSLTGPMLSDNGQMMLFIGGMRTAIENYWKEIIDFLRG